MSSIFSPPPESFLGINYNGMHDSSICVADATGRPLYAVSEERFSRVKQDGRFPRRALESVDLSRIRGCGVPYLATAAAPTTTTAPLAPLFHPTANRQVFDQPGEWHEVLAGTGIPLVHFDHHDMHAYTGLVLSGYPEALCLTADYGAISCPVTLATFHVRPGVTTRLGGASVTEHEPLAALYSDVTALLGFTPCRHEGKVTGLAAQGRPSRECRAAVWAAHAEIRAADPALYGWMAPFQQGTPPYYEVNRHLVKEFRGRLPFTDADIARAAQDLLTEKLLAVARWLAREHGTALPLILSGGVFANVRANLELAAQAGFPRVFVAPPMGDDGLAVGAAAAAAHRLEERRTPAAPVPMTLGPAVDAERAAERYAALGIHLERCADPATRLAGLLADGAQVALVRGRQEFGPRALGHRSVLAAATDPAVTGQLNQRLRRTDFMPFAPLVRAERVAEVFDLPPAGADVSDCLPFMTICLPVQAWVAAAAPAVVHVDGTARPQVVAADTDPLLHRVLELYEKATGVPVVINTSFNLHDEPLVSTEEDALAGFLETGLEALFVEDVVVERARNPQAAALARLMGRIQDVQRETRRARHAALSESFGRHWVRAAARAAGGNGEK